MSGSGGVWWGGCVEIESGSWGGGGAWVQGGGN